MKELNGIGVLKALITKKKERLKMNNKFTKEELEKILNLHEKWLNGGKDGVRADLFGVNLSKANLSKANLSEANLSEANLSEANLCRSNLSGANLRGANLSEANLIGDNLCRANLFGANLCRANLKGADLNRADLFGADLSGARINYPICCPEKGSFIGFKKASNHIVELEILSNSLRSSSTSRKCRCNKARVLSITKLDGTDDGTLTVSSYRDKNFIYKIGEIIEVKDFDTNRWNECSTGIHFFITRQEAVDYFG